MDHDDPTETDRDRNNGTGYGSRRRYGASTLFDGLAGPAAAGLVDRFLRDVTTWLDEEGLNGQSQRSRSADASDDDRHTSTSAEHKDHRPSGRAHRVGGAKAGRRDKSAWGSSMSKRSNATNTHADPYDDERPSGSMRGQGPKDFRLSDKRRTERVSEALLDDPQLDARDIEVSVKSGDITLRGTVATRWAKHHAENLAARAGAGPDVENQLRVTRVATNPGSADATAAGGRPAKPQDDSDEYGHPN